MLLHHVSPETYIWLGPGSTSMAVAIQSINPRFTSLDQQIRVKRFQCRFGFLMLVEIVWTVTTLSKELFPLLDQRAKFMLFGPVLWASYLINRLTAVSLSAKTK